MTKTDRDPPPEALVHPGDPGAAVMLLSRLPVPSPLAANRGAAAAWAWPLVGAIVATLGWLVGAAMLAFGLPPSLAAGAALAASIAATGALHEDGFADCADGIWGGASREKRLEIMRDSRVGSYGVLALVFVVGLRWLALSHLFAADAALAAWVAAAMVSRAGMAGLMAILPFARDDGLAAHVGRPSVATAALGMALALCAAVLLTGAWGILAAMLTLPAVGGLGLLARAKLGGQTGDVLGASQLSAEIVALLVFVAVLA